MAFPLLGDISVPERSGVTQGSRFNILQTGARRRRALTAAAGRGRSFPWASRFPPSPALGRTKPRAVRARWVGRPPWAAAGPRTGSWTRGHGGAQPLPREAQVAAGHFFGWLHVRDPQNGWDDIL